MRYLYNLLLYLLAPLIILRLVWRGRKSPGYRKRWLERFAYFSFYSTKPTLWIHAVSVGEVLAAVPLVKLLSQQLPDYQLVVTSTTPTGSERVMANLPSSVFHIYSPYDLSGTVQRFLKKIKPKLLILMETELWPNLLHYCHEAKLPILLLNARLSPRSLKGYARLPSLVQPMMDELSLIAAQSFEDGERFKRLGAAPEKVMVAGNVKFEIDIPASLRESGEVIRQQFGNRPTWIAASTHEFEEEMVLEAFRKVREVLPSALLILVPRHPERFEKAKTLIEKMQFTCRKRSQCMSQLPADMEVFLVDTMGELRLFFAASDVAFVGGSLVPHGGHNTLEPAAFSLPVISGPHVFNFAKITELLLEAGGLSLVNTPTELADSVTKLLLDADLRVKVGEAALNVVNSHKGALEKYLALVRKYLCAAPSAS